MLMKIAIDAGHGGDDPGAVNTALNAHEADIALEVAELLALNLSLKGYETIMTRTRAGEKLSLTERAIVSNRAKASCFVSIHCNGAESADAHGSETWYHPASKLGKVLATELHSALVLAGGLRDRGIKTSSRLGVLRLTAAPAALVELGFMTNEKDCARLLDRGWKEAVAKRMAEAIVTWRKNLSYI